MGARRFVTSYSNGYIFYAPTEEQLANVGAAQVRKTPCRSRSWANASLLSVLPQECVGQLAHFGST